MFVLPCRFLDQREARPRAREYDGGLVPKLLRQDVISAEQKVDSLLVAVPVREENGEAFGTSRLEFLDEGFVSLCRREHLDVATQRNPARVGEPVLAESRHRFFRGCLDAVETLEFLAGVPERFLAGERADAYAEFFRDGAAHVGHGEIRMPEPDKFRFGTHAPCRPAHDGREDIGRPHLDDIGPVFREYGFHLREFPDKAVFPVAGELERLHMLDDKAIALDFGECL